MCIGRFQLTEMKRTCRLLIFFGVVLLGSAQDISCTVYQELGWTVYSVPEFSAMDCHYLWSNETEYVIANHAQEPKYPVANMSSTSLTTSKCLETVSYMRDCISEGSPRRALCKTACTGNAELFHNDGAIHSYWIAGVVACSLVLVVLLIAIVSCVRSNETLNTPDAEEQRGRFTVV